MPIYEFRCLKCRELTEFLLIKSDQALEMKCTHCGAEDLERVMSAASHSVSGGGVRADSGPSTQTRNCPGGSCTTYDIPGPNG